MRTLDRAFLQLVHAFSVTDAGVFRFLGPAGLESRVIVPAEDDRGFVGLTESLASQTSEVLG